MGHESYSPSRSRAIAPEAKRKSSSDSHSSTSSSTSTSSRTSIERQYRPKVEIMRCSRCAKAVETISISSISSEEAMASGMVKFGHNLYYCERCAKIVGYT